MFTRFSKPCKSCCEPGKLGCKPCKLGCKPCKLCCKPCKKCCKPCKLGCKPCKLGCKPVNRATCKHEGSVQLQTCKPHPLGIQIHCYIGKPAIKNREQAEQHLLATVTEFISAIADHGIRRDYQVHLHPHSIHHGRRVPVSELQRVQHRFTPYQMQGVAVQNNTIV